ncbi:putative eka-like protein [Erysiphe necator]|uniref:Putative eka-like protein n=1 Tax=Uncinula necator TaxID=52586 RepID=A0A0B1PE80_UNCNE|nr:putative eka-like protein [Erysiphe necator]
MPAVRTKRQFTMADIAKSRAKVRLKNKGLAPDLIDINAFESAINDNDSPGIEMIDEEIDRLIAKGLEASCWANTPTSSSTSSSISVDTPKPADQTKSTPTPPCSARLIIPTSEGPIVIDLSTSQEFSRTPATNTLQEIPVTTVRKLPCPPKLQEVVKAEEHRAAQMAANLEVCSVAINGVEDALAHLTSGTRNDFVVSLKVYLKNAISQFIRSGTSAIPPSLPCRPTGPFPAVPVIKNTARSTPNKPAFIILQRIG